MSEIKAAYALAAEAVEAAFADASGLAAERLSSINTQLAQATATIAESLLAEVPAVVSAGQSLYGAIDAELLGDLFAGSEAVTRTGIENMIVRINQRLIADTVNRMYQDGYTLSSKCWEIGGDYQTQITRLINSGIAQGKSTADIARSIGDYTKGGIGSLDKAYTSAKYGDVVVKNVDWRALRLVRTELGASMKIGAVMQGEQNPGCTGEYDWLRINTAQHSCLCPDLAAGSPYKAADVPSQPHPNCHPAGTMVLTPSGEVPIESLVPGDFVISHDGTVQAITHCWKTKHDGELLELISDGRKIQATPGHPFLIGDDWVLAHDIKPGDNITSIGIDVESIPLVKFVSDSCPPKRLNEFNFFNIFESFLSGSMPTTAINFDGKFYVFDSQIDIESPDCQIRERLFSKTDQGIIHNALVLAPDCSGVKLSYGGSMFVSMADTPNGIMSRPSIGNSPVGVTPVMPLGNSRNGETIINKVPPNATPGYSKDLGDLVNWEVLVTKQVNQHQPINIDFTTHSSAIVSAKSEHYKGYVYNLTVANTHTFIANGFASHNCACQIRPRLRDLKETTADIKRWSAGESVPYLDEWYGRNYSATS
jgi:hypothetical protein